MSTPAPAGAAAVPPKKKRAEWIEELKEPLLQGDIMAACAVAARAVCIKPKPHFLADLLVAVAVASNALAAPTYAKYLASRLRMLMLRKDARALTRLTIEVVAVLCGRVGGGHIDHPRGDSGSAEGAGGAAAAVPKEAPNQARILLDRLTSSPDLVHDTLRSLLKLKGFEVCVPVESVGQHLTSDPLWYAWQMVVGLPDPGLRGYVADLYYIYRFRFTRSLRKERLPLLQLAWEAYWRPPAGAARQPSPLTATVAEAALKACYLYDQEAANAAEAQGAAAQEEAEEEQKDILSTMLTG